jgi:2-methylcitrate dehydratase PrpD
LADYTDELANDPRRRALMSRVDVVPDDRCDKIFPAQFPAVLTARTRDGREWTEEVLANRGGPQRPLSDEELALKFRDNTASHLSAEAARRVAEQAHRLDELPNISQLLQSVTR